MTTDTTKKQKQLIASKIENRKRILASSTLPAQLKRKLLSDLEEERVEMERHLESFESRTEVVAELRVSWKRRGAAYTTDCALFYLFWGVIDNVVWFPINEGFMSLMSAGLFCLYFGLTEGTGAIRASPGKRGMGLKVVLRDGGQPSRTTIMQRSAILAAFQVLGWDYLLPSYFSSWLLFVPTSIILYNGWLAVRGQRGLMLQDGLTYTQVVRSEAASVEPSEAAPRPPQEYRTEWPRRNICMGMILIAVLVSVPFQEGRREGLAYRTAIEKGLAAEIGIRSRVGGASMTEYQSGEELKRAFGISVWVPLITWNQKTMRRLVENIGTHLKLEPCYYHSFAITLSTGIQYFGVSQTSPLQDLEKKCLQQRLDPRCLDDPQYRKEFPILCGQ